MLRVGKDNEADALAFKSAVPLEQGGRRMGGMVFVDADACSDAELKKMTKLALSFVKSLPPK